MEKITIVTVTIFDADYTTACASSYVSEQETLEEVIEQVKDDAWERFNEDGGSAKCRVIVNVNTAPMPSIPATIVNADVPEGEADAMVTATVAA